MFEPIDQLELESRVRQLVNDLITKANPEQPPQRKRAFRFHDENEMTVHFANHLDLLEPGLRLFTETGERGIEFPCQIRNWGRQGSMDVLAVDRDGGLVVIEFKAKYGTALALGQVLGYMAWIRNYLFNAPPTPTPRQLVDDPESYVMPNPLDVPIGAERDARLSIPIRGFIVCKKATPMLRLATSEAIHADITLFEYSDSMTVTRLQS